MIDMEARFVSALVALAALSKASPGAISERRA
jgi:hypothetical protein